MNKYEHKIIPRSAIIGFLGLFAGMVAIAVAKKTGALDYELAKRCVGVVLGLMLVCAGNLLPKFRMFDTPGSDPVHALAAERFAGWVFVLAGAAYVAVWALAPTASATLVSSMVGIAAFAFVGLDWLRRAGRTEAPAARPQASEATLVKKFVLGTILITLGWVIVIFLVDHIWGDTVSRWVGIIYSLVIASLVVLITAQLLARNAPLDDERPDRH
jgi:hypothetical protein